MNATDIENADKHLRYRTIMNLKTAVPVMNSGEFVIHPMFANISKPKPTVCCQSGPAFSTSDSRS